MNSREDKADDKFTDVRERMMQWDLIGRGISDACVLDVMRGIRREAFVPPEYYSQAYDDGPLPIGLNQTISQPYIVALMTQELKVNSDCEVLEIGTGSGYQTAILGKLAKKVYTIERFEQLSLSAQAVLSKLGITNVEFFVGDGSCGWPQEKVFDRIMITAAVPKIPEPLQKQLADGGVIVAPIDYRWMQDLVVCAKKGSQLKQKSICGVRFVRLIGEYGFGQ
jgi:protein-L-isoaspartate(D-aspartate) O-methyltransferase